MVKFTFSTSGMEIAAISGVMKWTTHIAAAIVPALLLAVIFFVGLDAGKRREVLTVLKSDAAFLDAETRGEIANTILHLSKKYDMDPLLILAVVKVESRFQIEAKSHRGALGLMQVKPIVVRDIANDLGIDPVLASTLQEDHLFNLLVGVHYLSSLMKQFEGDLPKALMAYNRGPTAVKQTYGSRSVPICSYQKKVFRTYQQYASLTQRSES